MATLDEEFDALPDAPSAKSLNDEFDALPDAPVAKAPQAPAPKARVKEEPSIGETLARKGLGAATALTEVIPGATQAVAGLRSVFGDRDYEEELAGVREEQQMMRKLEPAVTGMTRGAGNVALSVPAMALGGPLGLGALTGAQALSRGADAGQAAMEAGLGAAAGPLLSRAPAAIQAAAPVIATGGAALGAKDQSALWEAITGLVPSLATAGSQAVRGAYRGLEGRAKKAADQLFFQKADLLAKMERDELEEAAKAVASADMRRLQLTGEQQTRLANAPKLEEAGSRLGLTPPPATWLPAAAKPEAEAAYESFFRNAPGKFTTEPAEVAAKQAAAAAEEAAAQAKWLDPEAVAAGLSSTVPAPHGPVSPGMTRGAELLRAKDVAEARSRVPEEIKTAGKYGALLSLVGAAPSAAMGRRDIAVGTLAGAAAFNAGRKIRYLLAVDPKTKLFKDPAAANVIYDAIPSVIRKFPDAFGKYASLVTDKGIRARPVFLLDALRRDPDLARAVEEEVTGEVSEE